MTRIAILPFEPQFLYDALHRRGNHGRRFNRRCTQRPLSLNETVHRRCPIPVFSMLRENLDVAKLSVAVFNPPDDFAITADIVRATALLVI